MTPSTDFPPSLVEDLAACLRAIFQQKSDSFCIIDWNDYYVQYHGRAEYDNLWFEAVSDYWMERIDRPLSAEQKAALAAKDFLPLGTVANNYCRFLPITGEADFEAAARYGLGILRDVYGWRGEDVRVECPLRDLQQQAKAAAETPPEDSEAAPPRRDLDELPCGQILGDASAIGPFLFIALEHPDNALYTRRIELGRPGVYAPTIGTNHDEPPMAGFILPLSACHDDALARALRFAATALADPTEVSTRRGRALAALNKAGLPVTAGPGTGRNGCLALSGLEDALPRLADAMDYATRILDDPDGEARITATESFPHRDYWSLLRWMHQDDRDHAWSHPSLFLVDGGISPLRRWWGDTCDRREVTSPELRLSRFFQLRKDLPEEPFAVSFVQEDYGWVRLTVTLGGQRYGIDLSNVFWSFGFLIEWLKQIGDGEEATAVEIDEEGPVKRLEVLTTDDPRRLLFLIKNGLHETIYIQGIIDRSCLLETFKATLFHFLQNDFSAAKWVDRWGGDQCPYERLRQDILADPWFLGIRPQR